MYGLCGWRYRQMTNGVYDLSRAWEEDIHGNGKNL